MGESMNFPDNPMDFISDYSFEDKKKIYTNGSMLVPLFRVEQMVEHYIPRWIPVKERLPEEDEYVIITGTDGIAYIDIFSYGFADIDDVEPCFYRWNDEYGQCFKPDVLAWIPIPEPYKE